ncbi:VOC family protein [Tabrizicola sp. BL-A-41-H6]|uniref:VOC family protein n=1 Tax=Tabrizicola sp. BL-A-41-H6 TaxID=3421107 RepID=UPI003D6671D1
MALVPELCLTDPEAGIAFLHRVFGFAADGSTLTLGSQTLRVRRVDTAQSHGRIDHIALAVPDIDASLARLLAGGASLDSAVTPNGVGEIAEFWGDGIRYVYLQGPEAARIELCQRNAGPVAEAGHDHIGIPCRDLARTQRFFEDQGAVLVAAVDLPRAEGTVPVRFLTYAGGMIELYAPAGAGLREPGLWSRLLVEGLAGERVGPDGLILAPL